MVALRDLPGAQYVLVVDASGDRVRGELGGPPDAELAVLSWARRLADVSRERGRALEDVVLTTETVHHLVRAVPGTDGAEDVWVALRIDREQGNLALARRALSALASGRSTPGRTRALPAGPSAPAPTTSGPVTGSFPAAMPHAGGPVTGSFPAAMPLAGPAPAPYRVADPEPPHPTTRSTTDVPALALLPPGRPARGTPVAVPPRVDGAADTADATDGPFVSVELPAPADDGPPVDDAVDASDAVDGPFTSAAPDTTTTPGMWDARRRPLTVRQARTWRTAPEVPAAREPAEHATPAPEIPAPRVGSLFAPVVVVPPPPSPVDDDTTEVPAPVPYPIITAPPLTPEPVEPAPGPAPEVEPAAVEVGLPRRVPGAHLRSPSPAPEPAREPALEPAPGPADEPAPEPAPAAALSATGLPGWSTEPSVLRRLVLGLRRLT